MERVVGKIYNEEELIRKAKSIKNRKERITFIFDQTCKILDNQFDGENVCGFKNCKCIVQRDSKSKCVNGCCKRCIYQTDKGCSSSNVSCKLFFCSAVTEKYKPLRVKDIKLLKLLSFRQRVILKHAFFTKREEALKDLYIGSLLIFGIRIVYRVLFKNIIWRKQ